MFTAFVARHQAPMTKVALRHVRDPATAQEVVQETWLAVIRGISQFRGRGSFENWVYSILVNLAKSRGVHDARVIPFAADDVGEMDGAGSPEGAVVRRPQVQVGDRPPPWGIGARVSHAPEDELGERETIGALIAAISELPVGLRAVIYLRDVRGLTAEETCLRLRISDVAQRVRLHRARTRVCQAVHSKLRAPSELAVPAGRDAVGLRKTA
jgi:RNA polymerase sigma-70 factor (ECF subfamily)